MAILRSRTTTANKALTQYKDALDAGSGPGTAKIYSGTIPATPETAATGTLLAELVLTKPCGVVADKKLTFSAITQDLEANNTGVASHVRLADSDGNVIIDGDVSGTGGTGVLKLNTTIVTALGPVFINSFELSIP